MSTEIASKKIVPGAPPPAPLTKSQKKKRRAAGKKDEEDNGSVSIPDAHTAALVDKAPGNEDLKSGDVAPQLVANDEQPKSAVEDSELGAWKPSPVVDNINKRVKALSKKLVRFSNVVDLYLLQH